MLAFVLRRIAVSLLTLLLVLSFTFFFLRLLPGDPATLFEGGRLTAAQHLKLRHLYGLDRPLPEQYLVWISSVARWDWGTSLAQQRPVSTALLEALPATVLLAFSALALEYLARPAARHRLRPAAGIVPRPRRAGGHPPPLLPAPLLAGADGDPPLLLRLAGAAGGAHALGRRRPPAARWRDGSTSRATSSSPPW